MCIIERKTYYHTDGREETIEKTRPCHRAFGKHLCRHVERRSFEAARIVETKPSSSSTKPPGQDRDGYIVTEGSRGQQRMYLDLSTRSSNGSSSIRRSATMSERTTPISTPSSASSPSYLEIKPEASSPPPAAPGFIGERTRTPYSSSKPRPSFTKNGTAIYERTPSLDRPRALDNELPQSSRLSKESSFSSTTAEVDDTVVPDSSQRRRHPSISIDTTARPATPSSNASATMSSPGLSQLNSALRRDSGKDVKRKSSLRQRSDSDRQRQNRKDEAEENDRQARLERERLAQSDRRQSARDKLARDASRERRERHRREAAAALEGTARPNRATDNDDPIQRGRDAERAEMERERERAAQLHRDEDAGRRQYVDEQQQRRDARIMPSTSRSPTSTRNRITSARAFDNTTGTAMQPRIHQNSPTIAQRGEDVIARERARAAGQSLNDALAGMNLQEREAEEYQARREQEGGRYRYGGSGGRRYR